MRRSSAPLGVLLFHARSQISTLIIDNIDAAGPRRKLRNFPGENGDYEAASSAASSMSTVTSRDTPGSCIVTPINCVAISIAILLCVM